MGVKLVSSSGGSVELVAPTTASNFTHTVPAQTGTVLLKESTSGMSVPAFSAYATANQSTTSGSTTKVVFNAEDFDTANCFDNTTNYRFTPNVAGYYQINAVIGMNGASTRFAVYLYKNGSSYRILSDLSSTINSTGGSTVLYMNGSTDYVEIYTYQAGGTGFYSNGYQTWISGALVRAA